MLKETLINNILYDMLPQLNKEQSQILEHTLQKHLFKVELLDMETALATAGDTNEYLIEMMVFKMKKKLSDKSIYQYRRAITAFSDFCSKSLEKVTGMDVELYLDAFARGKNKSNTNTSINNERKYLSACFKWMRRASLLTNNPTEAVDPLPMIKKPIDHLEGVEVEALRDFCEDLRERALVEFLLSTACRVGEAENVKVAELDLVTGRNVVLYGSKTREFRYAFLNDAARYHIKKYLDSRTDDCEYLFVNSRAKVKHGISACTMRDILSTIKKRAKMARRVYPHLMRKTFATEMRGRGMAIEDIAGILGHSDVSTTLKHYAGASTEQLSQAHKKCASL